MYLIKYFLVQLIFFGVIIFIGFCSDRYISRPFTLIDMISIILYITLLFSVLTLYNKFKKGLKPISLFFRLLFSFLAIIISIIIIGFFIGEM